MEQNICTILYENFVSLENHMKQSFDDFLQMFVSNLQ